MADRILPEALCMVQQYGLEPYADKIADGGQYIDTDLFIPRKALADRDYSFGFVGRLAEEKGVLSFIQALPGFLEPGERVVIAGDGPLRKECKDAIDSLGLSDRVVLAGWVENRDLPDMLNEIRVLLVPSRTEGLPNILLEGMACGCLMIASSVGGIPDLVSHGATGFLLPDTEILSIVGAVAEARTHGDLESVAAAGRRRIESDYSHDAALSRYREVIRGLV
jgi:glycosyltransferase involved in cell wall biosynthesis